MSNKSRQPSGYVAHNRYIFNGIRNQGWTPEASIFELEDNEIDAGATVVDVKWEKSKTWKADNPSHNFSISGNGRGIEKDKMISSFGTLGTETEYQIESIGNYGVGGTAALINLGRESKIDIKSSHANSKETSTLNFEHTANDDQPDFPSCLKSIPYDGKSGVDIKISNVISNLSETKLMRDAGVVYFPNYDRYNKKFKMTVNERDVEFTDPLYRNTKWKEVDGVSRKTVKVEFGDDVLEMDVLRFMPDFDEDKLIKYHWDVRGKKGSFLRDNSGLYIRVGGRYINTGQHLFPGASVENTHNRLRFEITIPHELIEKAGVEVNKSKASLPLDNPLLQDLQRVIRAECRNFINDWLKVRGKKVSNDDKKLLKKINDNFNSKLRKLALPSLAKGITGKVIEKRVSNGRDPNGDGVKPKGTGRKRGGNTVAKAKKLVRWNFEHEGGNEPMYRWSKDNDGILNISINSDTAWGALVPRGAGNEVEIQSLLWEIYGWISIGVKEAANKLQVEGLEASEKVIDDMHTLIADKTYDLNRLLR